MSKKGYISRYLLIIKKLRAKPYSTFAELQSYIEHELDNLQMMDEDLKIGFSIRTLQRDIREISNVFGIDIEYSRSLKGYFISHSESENMNFQRMMEAYDMFASLNLAKELTTYIRMEKRRPQGTENLHGLLHAIRNCLQIKFIYHKFYEEQESERSIFPYALKEFRNRWYVIGQDTGEESIRCYGLDRLSRLEITSEKFIYPGDFSIDEYYRYCFGIIKPYDENEKVHEIILSFNAFQGKYVKTLPFHDTQQVIMDNDNEYRIKLKLYITHDLVMELLSYGDNLTVLKPQVLINELKNAHEKAFGKYDKNE